MVGSRWSNRFALLGLAVCAVSCEGNGENYSNDANGDLGYIDFRWVCTGQADLACESDWDDVFTRAVALGSTFDADFQLTTRIPSELNRGSLLLSAGDGVRTVSGDYEALEESQFTLMALMADDSVADFATVEIRPVDSLRIVHGCGTAPSDDWGEEDEEDIDGNPDDPCGRRVSETQKQGEYFDLRVMPYGAGEALIGDLEYEWEVVTDGRIEVIWTRGNNIRVRPIAPGPGEIVVRHGDLSRTLTFVIEANNQIDSSGPSRTRPGETGGETDGETDGDTEGETDTDSGETEGETETGTGSTGGMR